MLIESDHLTADQIIARSSSPSKWQKCEMSEQPETLNELVDEFCYELALILRRVLNLIELEEETDDDETADD